MGRKKQCRGMDPQEATNCIVENNELAKRKDYDCEAGGAENLVSCA